MFRPLIILGIFAITGSQVNAQSLVGKWDCSGRQGPETAFRSLQEYRANGSLYHLLNFTNGDEKGRMDTAIKLQGQWELTGDQLLETISDAELRSVSSDGKDITDTPVGQIMKREMPKRMANPSRPTRTFVKFVSPSKFEMVIGQSKGTCIKR